MTGSTLTRTDRASWLATVWDVLHMAREDCISEDDGGPQDETWNDVTTAMAWIGEALGLPTGADDAPAAAVMHDGARRIIADLMGEVMDTSAYADAVNGNDPALLEVTQRADAFLALQSDTDITSLAATLRDGAGADIWYDASSYGEEETAGTIAATRMAMRCAADLLAGRS